MLLIIGDILITTTLGGQQKRLLAANPSNGISLFPRGVSNRRRLSYLLGKELPQKVRYIMKEIYKMTEWQDAVSGTWHCNDVSHGSKYAVWWVVPRLLGITPAEYTKLLIETFHAEVLYFSEKDVLLFKWRKQSDMRRFKNTINRIAREKNFYIEN